MVSKASADSAEGSKDTQFTRKSRGKRGKVCLNKVAQRRVKGVIEHVDFNKDGQPVGEIAAEMQSYIGLLTRDHVRISIKSWRQVPQDVKDLIWEQVKSSYKVPEQWKVSCLDSASQKWRTWKCRMKTDHILPNLNDNDKLYTPPPGIRQTDWDQFVKSRTSSEFKKLSEEQKQRRKKHLYPHRLSRKGYARFAEDIKESELCGDEEVDRATLWKKARLNKDGKTDNDNLKIAIQKIDEYIREKDEGKLDSETCSSDLLSRALDKPEHSGRVRGKGAGVKPKSYFQCAKEMRRAVDVDSQASQASQVELAEAKKKIEEQEGRIVHLDKLFVEVMSRLVKLEGKGVDTDKNSEGLGSWSVIKAATQETQKEKEMAPTQEEEDGKFDVCEGLVDKLTFLKGKTVKLLAEISKKLVAYGTVFLTGDVIHGSRMPEGCFRVSIDEVVDENARLPFRISDELETVGSALGTHVAWPSDLVEEKSNETLEKKKVGKKLFKEDVINNLSLLPSSLTALYCLMKKSFNDQGIRVTLDDEVFGHDITVWVLLESDVIPFCNLAPITGNCIAAYIWHHYKIMKENDSIGKFLFVNMFSISHQSSVSIEDRARTLSERLLVATSNSIVFVPCNTGMHWILTIFDIEKDRVYLMDPLSHRHRDASWKSVVDTAMNIINAQKGKKLKKSANWDIIKGPVQPDDKQCGYYVMRFIRDIIRGFKNDILLPSLFKDVRMYSQAQIDEVREEWASCVIQHIFD